MSFENFIKELRTAFFTFFIFSLLTFFQTPNVFACSCLAPSIKGAVSSSDAVFVGKVSNIESLNDTKKGTETRIIVTFNVSQWWKGPNEKQAVLQTVHKAPAPNVPEVASCDGYPFKKGEEYLVYAFKQEDGTLGTSPCIRTNILAQATEDLAELGKGTLPADGVQSLKPESAPNNFSSELDKGIPPVEENKTPEPKSAPSNFLTEIVVGIIVLAVIGVVYKILVSRKGISKS